MSFGSWRWTLMTSTHWLFPLDTACLPGTLSIWLLQLPSRVQSLFLQGNALVVTFMRLSSNYLDDFSFFCWLRQRHPLHLKSNDFLVGHLRSGSQVPPLIPFWRCQCCHCLHGTPVHDGLKRTSSGHVCMGPRQLGDQHERGLSLVWPHCVNDPPWVPGGDKVFYYRFPQPLGISRKFLPSWSGPFEIVGKLSPVAYQIRVTIFPAP